jgi:hypothetical protein
MSFQKNNIFKEVGVSMEFEEEISLLKRWILRIIFTVVTIAIAFSACSYINQKLGKSEDWIGEELVEDVIEHHLGIEIDLTPNSIEE